MKVIIDEDSCTGCGMCEEICPEVFRLGDEIATILIKEIPQKLEESVSEAKDNCPVEAIIIEE